MCFAELQVDFFKHHVHYQLKGLLFWYVKNLFSPNGRSYIFNFPAALMKDDSFEGH